MISPTKRCIWAATWTWAAATASTGRPSAASTPWRPMIWITPYLLRRSSTARWMAGDTASPTCTATGTAPSITPIPRLSAWWAIWARRMTARATRSRHLRCGTCPLTAVSGAAAWWAASWAVWAASAPACASRTAPTTPPSAAPTARAWAASWARAGARAISSTATIPEASAAPTPVLRAASAATTRD